MIKLYLDEDVPEAVAIALRLRGYDVLTVKEVGRKGSTDIEQLQYASSQKRIILTHNIADFCKIHSNFIKRSVRNA
jgi:predicted nuclease of predicted toxin-antitoxin system